jgi:thioredoxin-like negative regulator of GroEL
MELIEVKTTAQFKKHVTDSDVPVMVYFYAPW